MGHSWSRGYVADITYSHGYFHELSPPFIRFCLLLEGLDHAGGESDPDGRYHYCELGYGQGVSANLHAAANPRGRFWGTDFNPDHALFAQGVARQAGVDAQWLATGFDELIEADLPDFDFVGLHGVWSWIDAPTRQSVVEFLRRRLKVGGVVYLSYNVMPGWSAEKPLRDLLWLQSELAGSPGDPTPRRIKGALDFAQVLRRGRAAYFEHNPRAGAMLEDMQRDDIHVVAHEYFNRSWHITYFADLARGLQAAGLEFGCSLHKSDLVGEVRQRAHACGLDTTGMNPALRETTHDFILNRRFRRDVFTRGARRLSPAAREARLLEVGFVLMRPASAATSTVQTPYGSVTLDPGLLHKLLRVLEGEPAPVTLRELRVRAELQGVTLASVVQVLASLVAQGQAWPVFADDQRHAGGAHTRAANRAVAERALEDDVLRYLASPVTGHAIDASRSDRLLLLAWEQGVRGAQALADAVWRAAPDHWRGLLPEDGQDDAAAREQALAHARHFLEAVRPLWRRLGILQGDMP